MAYRSFTFVHPLLGSLTGLVTPGDKVVQFHSIPYATIRERFEQSVPLENINATDRDFTKAGFASPHTYGMSDAHSGGQYPGESEIKMNEYASLILTVSVPLERLIQYTLGQELSKLPVMTYIHGGAFILGKIDAQHNTAPLVEHSITTNQPTIAVAIQYRLGPLGFLPTPNGNKNLGLYDQRNALLWIQRFIAGFGGDPTRNTLFGESAGGYSICCHMLAQPCSPPLFNRVIIMSGVMGPMMCPVSEKKGSEAFGKICQILGIKEDGMEALDRMKKSDVIDLVKASDVYIGTGAFYPPIEDDAFFRETHFTWDEVPKLLGECEWVESFIVGCTGFEGAAYPTVAGDLTPEKLHAHVSEQLSNENAAGIMEAYGVTPNMDQNHFVTSAMRWCGDVIFDAPTQALCRYVSLNTNKRIYRYVFSVRNPFPGAPFYQLAHHWVDVYFLFRTMQFRFAFPWLRDVSDEHARMFISFANGMEPWAANNAVNTTADGGTVMVASDDGGWVEKLEKDIERVQGRSVGVLDKLWSLWKEKKGEHFLPLDLQKLSPASKVTSET